MLSPTKSEPESSITRILSNFSTHSTIDLQPRPRYEFYCKENQICCDGQKREFLHHDLAYLHICPTFWSGSRLLSSAWVVFGYPGYCRHVLQVFSVLQVFPLWDSLTYSYPNHAKWLKARQHRSQILKGWVYDILPGLHQRPEYKLTSSPKTVRLFAGNTILFGTGSVPSLMPTSSKKTWLKALEQG